MFWQTFTFIKHPCFVMLDLSTVLTFCICMCATYGLQSGADPGPLYTLYNDLLEGYKPYIRPRENPNDTVVVVVSYSMTSVEALDENMQTVASSGFLTLKWTDERLTWNPSEYGGIQYVNIPVDKLWIPDLSLTNGIDSLSLILPVGEMARVNNDGRVTWYKEMTKRTKCSLNMRHFPFDNQTCSISLIQWVTVITDINITAGRVEIETSMYRPNGEWEIIGKSKDSILHTFTDDVIQTEIVFTFVFKRKYLYYIITNILPVMLLSVLNLGVFLLPPESGEKISLCISIVLSYAVFLSVIGGSLPEVSDTVSIFSIYLLTMMFVKVVTTLLTVLVLNVYHGGTEKELSGADSFLLEHQKVNDSDTFCHVPEKLFQEKLPKKGNKELAKRLNRISFGFIFSLTVLVTFSCFIMIVRQ
ncbi:acetylcholine receptor subunit beta-like [Haliotis rufescens]|uniref:acetylcholine receptor subunit beta-like n=1 Tax=Haliotis rufescens TaxID=6454 RepID=UPI00201F0C10|nr:acetylcholine receptor subunit beta-like [Haliotis rufescens]